MPDIGKHFIVGVQGPVLSAKERELWKELRPLGVILFKRNISQTSDWPSDLIALISELSELSSRADFVASIDHEGGKVHRLLPPITQFPAAWNWREYSFAVGSAMGKELSSLGINLNFAPSFDVLTEQKNTVIGQRAFDKDPSKVLARALSFLDGMESQGVLGCAKHFPGHGGTVEDSHRELPMVETSKETLENQELIPFKGYIDSGRELIMTAHVVYKAFDPKNPATLSKTILTSILRKSLGYEGAIITDALDMGALAGITEAEVATKFIKAGGDLFCVCQDTNDKNAAGENISPIQAAQVYAEALASNQSLSIELARSTKSINKFLDKLKTISNRKNNKLTSSDSEQHAQLIRLINTTNA